MPLADSLLEFRNSINDANAFITMAFKQDASGRYILSLKEREFITDSAFLKMFIAWESFLESIFIKYMMGEPSISGRILARYVSPSSTTHAHNTLVGVNTFFDWAKHDKVKTINGIFFSTGNVIEQYINSINTELTDLRTIRNAAAHISSSTTTKLDAVATRLLRTPFNNTTVSQLLFSVDPTSPTGDTILTVFLAKLDIVAQAIANG